MKDKEENLNTPERNTTQSAKNKLIAKSAKETNKKAKRKKELTKNKTKKEKRNKKRNKLRKCREEEKLIHYPDLPKSYYVRFIVSNLYFDQDKLKPVNCTIHVFKQVPWDSQVIPFRGLLLTSPACDSSHLLMTNFSELLLRGPPKFRTICIIYGGKHSCLNYLQ